MQAALSLYTSVLISTRHICICTVFLVLDSRAFRHDFNELACVDIFRLLSKNESRLINHQSACLCVSVCVPH
jgi:hypothetical protein